MAAKATDDDDDTFDIPSFSGTSYLLLFSNRCNRKIKTMSDSNAMPESEDNAEKVQPNSMNEYLKPTYLLFGSCMPLVLGAYGGYKSELRRAASSSASNAASASIDAYSPGFTSSGGGLLTRVIGDEIMDLKPASSNKMKTAATKIAEQAHVPNVDVGRLAVKALGVGSLLSVAGFGFLTFGTYI